MSVASEWINWSECLRFVRDDRAATAIEYSIVAAGIALSVTAAIRTLGANVLNNLYAQLAGLFG